MDCRLTIFSRAEILLPGRCQACDGVDIPVSTYFVIQYTIFPAKCFKPIDWGRGGGYQFHWLSGGSKLQDCRLSNYVDDCSNWESLTGILVGNYLESCCSYVTLKLHKGVMFISTTTNALFQIALPETHIKVS